MLLEQTSAWQLEIVPDCEARLSLVQGIEVQPWRATLQQTFTHFCDDLLTERLDALDVVAIGFQLFAHPAWDFGATSVGKTRELAVVGDRHDARHDGDIHAHGPYTLDKVEVAVGIEEVLGDRTVGTGVGLAHEVPQVFFEVACLWVHLRVSRHFDVEVVAAFFADEAHQVVGVAQLTAGHAHAGRQVATQGNNALDAGLLVLGQQAAQVVLAVAHARKVRSGGNFDLAFQLQHGVDRAVTGRAAGAVGAGKEVGVVAGQLRSSRHQFFMPSIGLGREELEAVATFLGHGNNPMKLRYRKSCTAAPT